MILKFSKTSLTCLMILSTIVACGKKAPAPAAPAAPPAAGATATAPRDTATPAAKPDTTAAGAAAPVPAATPAQVATTQPAAVESPVPAPEPAIEQAPPRTQAPRDPWFMVRRRGEEVEHDFTRPGVGHYAEDYAAH